jgi:hypothetical protein
MPSKERLVLCLPRCYRNQLLWLAMKNRTTMSGYIALYLNNQFAAEVPHDFNMAEALRLVAQPDFEPDMIPYDPEGEHQYR